MARIASAESLNAQLMNIVNKAATAQRYAEFAELEQLNNIVCSVIALVSENQGMALREAVLNRYS